MRQLIWISENLKDSRRHSEILTESQDTFDNRGRKHGCSDDTAYGTVNGVAAAHPGMQDERNAGHDLVRRESYFFEDVLPLALFLRARGLFGQ